MKALKESNERKEAKEEDLDEDEDEDEDGVEFGSDEDPDMEEELNLAIAAVFGALFKTHKELTLPIVKSLYQQVLPNVFGEGGSFRMKQFGLFLIDDMLEHLGLDLLPNEWMHLTEALLKFSIHERSEVRKPAVFGIGVLAETTKEAFKEI